MHWIGPIGTMASHALVTRLTELNLQTEPALPPALSSQEAEVASAGTLLLAPPDEVPPGPPGELPVGLEMLTDAGPLWRIDAAVSDLWPEQERWLTALARCGPLAEGDQETPHAEITALREALPERVAVVDLETCGEMVYLVGVLHTQQQLPLVTQLLARSPAEEAALLTALDGLLRQKQVLVTFNGKTIDWPALQQRREQHQLGRPAWSPRLVHCDLLHHARRRWKNRLPNCKLQTLEQQICGRQRAEELPRDATQACQDYFRTGDPAHLLGVLHHNAMDLITLWQLALWMAR